MQPEVLDLRAPARRWMPDLGESPGANRAAAIGTWRGRMVNEYASAQVFEALVEQLRESSFHPSLSEECRGFADEERRHGVLCGAVVEALGGEARAPLPERPSFPQHEDAPLRAAVLRNVIHVCCMSETVAVSLIGAERLEMPAGALRDLLTTIYADEIGHARFGWQLLDWVGPELTDAECSAIERYLPIAFAHLVQHEHAHLPDRDGPADGERLGLCSGRDARVLLQETIDEVIRPRLRAWFAC
jgi:hypothetical protein